MFAENLAVVMGAIVVLVALWLIVAVRHFKHLRQELNEQWELVDEDLRKRYDLVPNLIETIRKFTNAEESLIEKIIKNRRDVGKVSSKDAERIMVEYDFTNDINELINLGKKYANTGLVADTNFLELRKEIDDLEKNIEDRTNRYNEMVRYYNNHRNVVFLKPIAVMWRFRAETIFEVEK
jgi:LemA protein